MNIDIICVGKLKEKYLKDGIEEYKKRLSRYCNINIIEVPDEKAPENISQKEEDIIKQKEGFGILKHVKDNSFVIALEIKGKMMSSEELADFIKERQVTGDSNLTFIIGGSIGLSKEVLQRANLKLSFSKMTFPHQLMRLILLEQIYRAFKIIKGEPYHK
ncbi:23S rRNA (pseudouridine1915-N3)-methyltransferase [Caloramator fervidus]|mgnify:CR=1 FL=1|uniref:Ribosomal RNA large subunit methyltransferase H n=1 Tax=Caloramator fervidus TaxID=29344 RepID=A0A1H5WNX1_9CLOT|nr:23S rRNA (pseudouridine(1915)-N(3))-methyltransferase RlmH [Caloramator fervidus]SEG00973.1 23S rRNA (pseudouridine1915-N3)-methyltransferase [Caloramator fervidus]